MKTGAGIIRKVVSALFVSLLSFQLVHSASPEYRMEDYRAPVPDTVPGGTRIGTDQAYKLHQSGEAVFIDVLPFSPRPPGLPKEAIFREKKRLNIPGSTWLPNVGYGALHPKMETYFKTHLERLSGGDKDKKLVIYCLKNCWMSWNAVIRASEYGYNNLFWYAEGTDGWSENLYELQMSKAEELPNLQGDN